MDVCLSVYVSLCLLLTWGDNMQTESNDHEYISFESIIQI